MRPPVSGFSPGAGLLLNDSARPLHVGEHEVDVTASIGIFHISILVLMLLGSLNFSFYYNLFHIKLHSVLTAEIKLYLGIITGATVLVAVLAWMNPL